MTCSRQRIVSALVVLGWVVACGGGGNDDGGGLSTPPSEVPSTPPPPHPEVDFVPSSLSETYAAGASVELGVKATLSAPFSGEVHVTVVDAAGVLMPEVTIKPDPQWVGSYFATFSTKPTLLVGRHQGKLEVRLCRDTGCGSQHPGSPWFLPYDFRIVPDTDLRPLTRWAHVNDWETFQGNAAHTGYVPVTLDASQFSPRWRWMAPENTDGLSPLVVAQGLIYLSSPERESTVSRPKLFALRESDKEQQWQINFSAYEINPPAVSGGKVFAATSGHDTTFMWSFDAATGAQLSKAPFFSQWNRYYAPTVEGGVVYTNGGSHGGMYAFNFVDGAQRWFGRLLQYDQWTPAVDAQYAYAYTGGVFSALDKSTGAVSFTIDDTLSFEWSGWSTYGAPVIGSNGSVVVVNGGNVFHDNFLVSFNPASRDKNWSIKGRYGGNPAIANGVIYVANTSPYRLEARSEATGALLWSWAPSYAGERARHDERGHFSDVLVTDNLVFVSTSKRVHAIDLATHLPVWSYWEPGSLALSANGVLYVQGRNSLGAVNLK
ncbi:PQQ-binding-like beta-propeller repeat protein [Hyalangium sp.]|uniref:outer membrane protein assembly factor BamB family protein n=1 Tax=Hyalangium sp. TaxID=2028555 RepID=UPI002D2E6E35|nr:PQQ-binding-like beta-propeller repeat protein [Hyalangium sp.]HYI01686.1 PQQ-binding-like beta-propeller repeat protein [Hyalangium sp.]